MVIRHNYKYRGMHVIVLQVRVPAGAAAGVLVACPAALRYAAAAQAALHKRRTTDAWSRTAAEGGAGGHRRGAAAVQVTFRPHSPLSPKTPSWLARPRLPDCAQTVSDPDRIAMWRLCLRRDQGNPHGALLDSAYLTRKGNAHSLTRLPAGSGSRRDDPSHRARRACRRVPAHSTVTAPAPPRQNKVLDRQQPWTFAVWNFAPLLCSILDRGPCQQSRNMPTRFVESGKAFFLEQLALSSLILYLRGEVGGRALWGAFTCGR